MIGQRQYKRSIGVKFGIASLSANLAGLPTVEKRGFHVVNLDDDGPRIQFSFGRSNRGEPDRGTLKIFNLAAQTRKAIQQDFNDMNSRRDRVLAQTFPDDTTRALAAKEVAAPYIVEVGAGYGGNLDTIFRGDMVRVKPKVRAGSVDFVTEIELGDSLLGLRDGYVNQSLGALATLQSILPILEGAQGVIRSPESIVTLAAVFPFATVTTVKNGGYIVGRPLESIDEIADLLGLQWWVRDGMIYYVNPTGVTTDFAIELVEGRDLLAFNSENDFQDIAGKAYLNGQIFPGRALVLKDENGVRLNLRGFRTNTARYVGDTHGSDWAVEFEASGLPIDAVVLELPGGELV